MNSPSHTEEFAVLYMSREEYARHVREKWVNWNFPVRNRSAIPLKPWHPDGDAKFQIEPKVKHSDSDKIVEHVKNSGALNVGTGSVEIAWGGMVNGVFLNVAKATDPLYTISRRGGLRNLFVSTYYRAPYGAKVRIPNDAIPQGYPMNEYSDHKLHVFDPTNRTILEVQYITEVRRNAFLNWLFSLFGVGGGYHCHGVTTYSLDTPSTDPSIIGSSAANWPIAESKLRFDDLTNGWRQMTTMAVPAAAKAPRFVAPARNSDGPSLDPHAIQMGMVMKLSDAAFERLSVDAGPQALAVLECWHQYGIMVIDTGGNTSFGLDLDPRWDQADVGHIEAVEVGDFEVWTH